MSSENGWSTKKDSRETSTSSIVFTADFKQVYADRVLLHHLPSGPIKQVLKLCHNFFALLSNASENVKKHLNLACRFSQSRNILKEPKGEWFNTAS